MRRKYCNTLAFSVVILMLASSISSLNLIASVAGATAKEKLVFKDDFSKTNLKQWTTMLGTWTVQNGKLTQMDNTVGDSWYDRPNIVAHCEVSSDFKIETKFNHPQGSIAILFRYQDIGNTEYVILHGGSNVIMGATVDGGERSVWHDYTYSLATEHTVTIDVHGSAVNVYIDGVFAASDNYADRGFVYSSGPIGFDTWYTSVSFDDVVVTEPAKVMHVYEGESIQAAVDAVFTGGKVIVHKGTYYQSFTVNKPMTVQGEGATLDCRSLASFRAAIDVVSSGVTISGFTIYTPKISFTAAIWFEGSPTDGGLVENNIIYCEFTAIFLAGSSIDIRNNVITAVYPIVLFNCRNINIKHNKLTAVPTDLWTNGMPSGVGIQFYGMASSVTIENNVIDATANGIETREGGSPIDVEIVNNEIAAGNNGIQLQNPSGLASNIVIANNKIYAEGDGINLYNMGMTNPVITKNVVYSDNIGIFLQSISEATVKHNEVHINEAKPGYPTGILISGGTSNQVAKNIVTGDFITGIFLSESNLNTIDKNVITGVYRYDPNYLDAGIRLWDANDNTGTKNLITGVRLPIDDQGSGNIFTP